MEKNRSIFEEPERLKNVQFSAIRTMLDKAAALRSRGISVIALSAGEPNFNTPERIKKETIKAIEQNYTHYGSNRGLPRLREIVAEHIREQTGVSYDPASEIVFTTGGAEALNNIILATVDQGDEVIVLSPAFVSYKNLVNLCRGVCVEVPLKPEKGFQIDLEDVKAAITPKTKMIIMNNPNNPTGAVYRKEDLEQLSRLVIGNNLLLLADEMYSSLVYEGEFVSMASFPGMKEHAIIVNGFSKTYAMTGWRLGYLQADRRLVTHIMKVHQYSSTCSPTFIQVGMAAAMDCQETKNEVEAMVEAFRRRRELVIERLEQVPGIAFIKPQGAFYVMADVSALGMTGEEFAALLLEKKQVAVIPAVSLGKGDACRDFIRISFAASEDDIAEGTERMKALAEEILAGGRKAPGKEKER
ncbi:MAG: pyridoxal phosphate-dependent aminotransferase [Enterocloster sp.]